MACHPKETSSAVCAKGTKGCEDDHKRIHRVNVNFSEEAWRTLQELAERRGKPVSYVIRDAIALERWFEEQRDQGYRILVESGGVVREVVLR